MLNEYLGVCFNLIVVIALMLAVLLLIKKFKLSKFGTNKLLNIVQVLPIGSKEKIVLLKMNDTYILLGATATHISALHTFDAETAIGTVNNKANDDEDFTQAFNAYRADA